jgi:hypothetical protein
MTNIPLDFKLSFTWGGGYHITWPCKSIPLGFQLSLHRGDHIAWLCKSTPPGFQLNCLCTWGTTLHGCAKVSPLVGFQLSLHRGDHIAWLCKSIPLILNCLTRGTILHGCAKVSPWLSSVVLKSRMRPLRDIKLLCWTAPRKFGVYTVVTFTSVTDGKPRVCRCVLTSHRCDVIRT